MKKLEVKSMTIKELRYVTSKWDLGNNKARGLTQCFTDICLPSPIKGLTIAEIDVGLPTASVQNLLRSATIAHDTEVHEGKGNIVIQITTNA